MTWNNMMVAAADAKFKKLMKDNGTLCAKHCGASRVRKDSDNDHVLNVPSTLSNDSLIFASVLLIVMPSVLCSCWLGGRKGIRPVKN